MIATERLVLRAWRGDDLDVFAAMNADPRVCEFLPSTLSRDESTAMLARAQAHWTEHGFGTWAVESREAARFLGLCGFGVPRFEAPFTPCVEIL